MLRYIAALLVIPFLDAVVLVALVASGTLTGVQAVALVVLTALVGMLLVRAEGRRTLAKIQRRLAAGEPPTDELLDGGLLIAAGAFLLTPGLVTDLVGILLTVPVTRIPIRMALKKYVVLPRLDDEFSGFASGRVWTYGFPDPDEFDADGDGSHDQRSNRPGDGGFAGGSSSSANGQDPIDLDDDAFDVSVEDPEDDRENDRS
jgi:UPF0716 protein FxsA